MQINPKKILGIGKKDDGFKEAVKSSFSRVKEHMSGIESGLKQAAEDLNSQKKTIEEQKSSVLALKSQLEADSASSKSTILSQNEQISTIISKLDAFLTRLNELEAKMSDIKVSIGSQGVYSNIHSLDIHSFTGHEDPIIKGEKPAFSLEAKQKVEKPDLAILSSSRQEILGRFSSLSKQELRTFLTIYELEEGKNSVSYIDIAKKLNLTEGCVRTYISSLMKKGIPVEKVKLNNKTVVLHVSKEFMELNLKSELVAIYYDTAQPNQRKLGYFD